jgi:hypothetical protein
MESCAQVFLTIAAEHSFGSNLQGYGMFEIKTARDFLNKAQQDLFELQKDNTNGGKAINAILSLYHVREWLWSNYLEPMKVFSIRGIDVKTENDFIKFLNASCPHFQLIRELANGSKHCVLRKSSSNAITSKSSGFGMGAYGVGPYGTAYLMIDLGTGLGTAQRFLTPHKALFDVYDFWDGLYNELNVP